VSKRIARHVDMWTFFLWQLGVFDTLPASQPTTP
jgi:hypothetical protein